MKQLLLHLRTVGTPDIYRGGESIFFQSEVPQFAVIVLNGVVKAYTISPEGDKTIVQFYGKGSILPGDWVNSQSSTALYNIDAVNDVRVLKVKRSDFQAAIESNPEFQREYLNYMLQAQAAMMLRITGLCQSRASYKICYTLYFLLFRYGVARDDDTYLIDLKLTQGMIAELIGQTRESTAKNLKALKLAGIVDYNSSSYSVDKRKLESYLGEDGFRDLGIARLR